MKVPKAANAMNHLDDDLIADAIAYKPKKQRFFHAKRWIAAAACLAVIAMAFGMFPFFGDKGTSPFVITAYALETDNSVSAAVMREGESVPVSLFETNDVKGFVFSRDQNNSHQAPSISVMGEGQGADIFDKIDGMPVENGKHYVLYVVDRSKTAPYSIMVPYTDEDGKHVNEVYLIINETEDGYTAVIYRIETRERVQLNK